MEENASIIANTTSQMTHVQNELATVALQQKVLEKQIHNVLVQQKNVREEIDAGIAEKDGLALEMVDLEQGETSFHISLQMVNVATDSSHLTSWR